MGAKAGCNRNSDRRNSLAGRPGNLCLERNHVTEAAGTAAATATATATAETLKRDV